MTTDRIQQMAKPMAQSRVQYAVFIRNIMVGRKGLHREALVSAFEGHGATHVQSVLATGNFLFLAAPASVASIVLAAREALRVEVGLAEPMFTRRISRLRSLANLLPFASADLDSAHERCISFMPQAHLLQDRLPYHAPRGDFVILSVHGPDVFSATWIVGNRPGQPGKWIEKQAGKLVTTRNWNTITRLLER